MFFLLLILLLSCLGDFSEGERERDSY
jgi:hypothetical protein